MMSKGSIAGRSRGVASRRARLVPAALIASVALGGCAVPRKAYEDQREAYDAQLKRNLELQGELEAARRDARAARGDSAAAADLLAERDRLREELRRARDAIMDFESTAGESRVRQLSPAAIRRLRQLAEQYDDIIFDESKPALRFASDVTFQLGSATLSDESRPLVQGLAEALNNPDLRAYDVEVVGHTDDLVPRATSRHKTNDELSVMRALAVKQALVGNRVPASRVKIAGWGEHRPAVANNERGGTAENRRVEIYLLTATSGGTASASSGGGAGGPPPHPAPRRSVARTRS